MKTPKIIRASVQIKYASDDKFRYSFDAKSRLAEPMRPAVEGSKVLLDSFAELARLLELFGMGGEAATKFKESTEAVKKMAFAFNQTGIKMTTLTLEQLKQWREEFEHTEWATDLKKNPDGSYTNYYIEGVWQGYLRAKTEQVVQQEGEPLTEIYIQTVPDKCDRIVWKGHYYHLPIKSPPAPVKMLDNNEFTDVWIECSDPQQEEVVMSEFAEKIQRAFAAKNNLTLEKL